MTGLLELIGNFLLLIDPRLRPVGLRWQGYNRCNSHIKERPPTPSHLVQKSAVFSSQTAPSSNAAAKLFSMSAANLLDKYQHQPVPQSYNAGFVALSCVVSLIGAASTLKLISRRTGSKGLFNQYARRPT